MKKAIIAGTLLLAATPFSFAEDLADPDKIRLLKEFAPPKPITPDIAQKYMPENQFDRVDRTQYFSVTDPINNGIAPLKLSSGFYGRSFYHSLLSGFRSANHYALLNLNYSKADNYKDAQGDKAGWGYRRFNQAMVLGWVPNKQNEYRLTFIHDDIDDDKQPQHQMDALNTERYVARFNARFGPEDLSDTLSAELGYRRLERRADNYTLRAATQDTYLKLERDIVDLTLKYDADADNWHNMIGAGYRHDEHDGKRYRHTASGDFLNGYRFAGLNIDRFRLFDNLGYKFNETHKLGLGLTYEFNHARVKRYDAQIPNPQNSAARFANPAQIWRYYFGEEFNGKTDQETVSAELKYDFTPTGLQKFSLSAAHIERTGDNIERFNSLAAIIYNSRTNRLQNQNPVSAVAGNPKLKPEEHNYVKFEFDLKNEFYQDYLNSVGGNGWNIGGSLLYDEVKNLIIFDRARGQSGTVDNSGGIITRNADARLVTANLHAAYNFLHHWAAGAKAFYNYGRNRSDGRPLYQIRPFELLASLDYKDYFRYGSYNIGTAVRYAAEQNRGDFDRTSGLGIDRREAAKSFVTADLYAGINFRDSYGVRLGVNNLFNRQYAEFISGDHVLALSPAVVVNAPGRTYWLSLHATF